MPFPNEHALRLRSPGLFDSDSFRRTKDGTLFGGNLKVPTSIAIIWAKLKGKAASDDPVIAQALRFDKSKWTETAARAWISKNIKRGIFEPASSNNTEKITDKDLVESIIQGDLEEYEAGDQIPYEDIEAMASTIEFSETEEYDATSILAAQLHQLNAEESNTDTTSTASESLTKEEKVAEAETQNLEGIEIFATGTFRGVTYTQDDLDEIAANFMKLRDEIKPPIKLGHIEGQPLLKIEGLPAGGWITKLSRIGDKLVADIIDVPNKIARIVKNRGYKRISSEIYTNLEHNGKRHGKVLKAIAFLGGDIPEVKTLDDMVAQYDDKLAGNEYRSVIYMADVEEKDVTEETTEEEEKEKETTEETTEEKNTEEVEDAEVEKEKEEKVEDTTVDNSEMEAKFAEQAKVIQDLKAKDAIRDQVIAKMQENIKIEKDEKNRLVDETFLTELTKAGKFPPSLHIKAITLLTELRTSDEKIVIYTENDVEVKASPFDLAKSMFSEWPQGISFKETAKGSEVIDPGSGKTLEVNKDGVPVYGTDVADGIEKYMAEHEGVSFEEAFVIIDAQMNS